MPFDADGWAKIITAVFTGLKECILAVAAVATIWYQAQNTGKLDAQSAKLDVAAEKADLAAAKSESVEKTVEETNRERVSQNLERDAQLEHIALTAKAILTQSSDDMNKAKAAEKKAEAAKSK